MGEWNSSRLIFADDYSSLFTWHEYLVFAAVLTVSMGIGVFYGCFKKNNSTTESFLMGGKKMGVLPVSLSLICVWWQFIYFKRRSYINCKTLQFLFKFVEFRISNNEWVRCINIFTYLFFSKTIQFYSVGWTSGGLFLWTDLHILFFRLHSNDSEFKVRHTIRVHGPFGVGIIQTQVWVIS